MHYYRTGKHCRFQRAYHCWNSNRHKVIGSDASLLTLPVLHPTLIGLKKPKKKESSKHARWSMLVHKSYKKQFIHHKRGEIHARNQRSSSKKQFIHYRQTRRDSTHHKSTHPQIELYITDNGEGLSTHQLIHKLIFQIDSYTIQGGEGDGRPRG